MRTVQRAWIAAALVLAWLAPLGSVTPAAAERRPSSLFMSQAEEARLGAEEHSKILAQFGGAIDDPALTAWVRGIGERLARAAGREGQNWTFTVLNSPVVNAFALPGGYVYVTRGLLALAGDEAQLAGVIGHEMGHVDARHSARRYDRQVLGALGSTLLGALFDSRLAGQVAQVGAGLWLSGYSRDQEYEADSFGVRYLAAAGYDPYAQADFLAALLAHSAWEAGERGQQGAEKRTGFFDTHPNTGDRVQRATALARDTGATPGQGRRDRDVLLRRLDGMIVGDDPAEGFIRGNRFLHPALGLGFTVPQGWQLSNTSQAVLAEGGSGLRMQFDGARDPGGTLADYLVRVWGAKLKLGEVETLTVGGNLAAATAPASVRDSAGRTGTVRLVVFRLGGDRLYRMLFSGPQAAVVNGSGGVVDTIRSFRRLNKDEAAAIRPLRLRLHTVRAGDTVDALAARWPQGAGGAARFRVLNGLAARDVPAPGTVVKMLVEG